MTGHRSLALVLPLLAVVTLAGCGKKESAVPATGGAGGGGNRGAAAGGGGAGGPGARRGPQAFPVEVETVSARDVEYAVQSVGSVEAFEEVAVTARVAGVVERVRFREGDTVSPSQVLVEIEPERFRLAVDSAQATLARGEAERAEAQAGLSRREGLNQKNPDLVRAEEVESWRTRVQVAAATMAQARAALSTAQLALRDAYTRAPVAGVIQTRTVQTGQYVQPGTVLATLVRREPLLLRFQVPEREAAALRPGIAARFTVGGETGTTPYTARLTHVAVSAEAQNRMVAVTAEVDDARRGSLRPGAFAQVTVPIGGGSPKPVIPQTAVRPSERGFLAYIVAEGTPPKAAERVLELGLRTADGRVEVRSGIQPGDRVVVRGSEALSDGVEVRVEGDAPPAGATPGPPAR